MNHVTLMGRLTKEPDVRYTQDGMAIARYTLAVDRRSKDKATDFISCITFGKSAEFAEKYLHRGTKILIGGRIQTGSYTNKDGQKVYTTDVIVDSHEFAESAKAETQSGAPNEGFAINEGFENIPDNLEDAGLPFN